MENDLSKIALMSGKLSGTKTFESTLDEKESLDDVETFFKNFIHALFPVFCFVCIIGDGYK